MCLPGVPEACYLAELLVIKLIPVTKLVLAPVGPAAGSVVALLHCAMVVTHSIEVILLHPVLGDLQMVVQTQPTHGVDYTLLPGVTSVRVPAEMKDENGWGTQDAHLLVTRMT